MLIDDEQKYESGRAKEQKYSLLPRHYLAKPKSGVNVYTRTIIDDNLPANCDFAACCEVCPVELPFLERLAPGNLSLISSSPRKSGNKKPQGNCPGVSFLICFAGPAVALH
jgi:hypothetical protein